MKEHYYLRSGNHADKYLKRLSGTTDASRGRVASPCLRVITLLLLFAYATARWAAGADPNLPPDRALDQSQMVPTSSSTSPTIPVNANGTALPASHAANTDDDSFGQQIILKTQDRPREFTITGDASAFFTSNAGLTNRDEVSDLFFVGDAGISWNHPLTHELQLQIGGHASLFRYNDTPALDFDNLGAGAGLIWTPSTTAGIGFFGRYDLIELLDRDGHSLLTDHELSLGMQKVIVLGRSHALSFSLGGAVGIADPHRAQRDLLGGGISYYLRLTRNLDMNLAYRLAGYFYNEGDRRELNQLGSLALSYHFNRWATLSAFASYGDNRSNHSVFDYKVFVGGGGGALSVQF